MRHTVLRIAAAGGAAAAAAAALPALAAEHSIGTGPGNRFTPDAVTVRPGDTVTIRNTSRGYHNVHWEDRDAAEMEPSPVPATAEWTTSRTFGAGDAGKTFRFYCEPHRDGGMVAAVRVEAPTSTEPGGTGTTPSPPPPTGTQPGQPPPEQPGPGGQPAGDQTAPTLAVRRAAASRRGVVLRLRLSERVRLVVRISRRGRRTTLRRRDLDAGAHVVRVRRRLSPGRWRVQLTTADAAGNTGAPRTLTLRVR